jgi:hypothetical protein
VRVAFLLHFEIRKSPLLLWANSSCTFSRDCLSPVDRQTFTLLVVLLVVVEQTNKLAIPLIKILAAVSNQKSNQIIAKALVSSSEFSIEKEVIP